MTVADSLKTMLQQGALQSVSLPLMNVLARALGNGVQRIFMDGGILIHQTADGYFAYHQPYLRLNLARMDEFARRNYFWGYQPKSGDVVIEVGAGVGEETLTFSRAVGRFGKVISIEAHPRTYRCLEKLVRYNGLENVTTIHVAVTEPRRPIVKIENAGQYLANRENAAARGGISVAATTLDVIHKKLGLKQINFLKMNIEGSERLAIHGMARVLKETEIMCVSCHDFLARSPKDDALRTKAVVREFFQQNGLDVVGREEPGLPPYIRDQLWAYNRRSIEKAAG